MSFTHGTASRTIRLAARSFLDGCQDSRQVEDSLLVITELVQNVVLHTRNGGDLTLTAQTGAVLIEVSDAEDSLPRLRKPDLRRPGGRGLSLVAAMSESWGTHHVTGGKVVWARMTAGPGALPA